MRRNIHNISLSLSHKCIVMVMHLSLTLPKHQSELNVARLYLCATTAESDLKYQMPADVVL